MKRKFKVIDMRCGYCGNEFPVSTELKRCFIDRYNSGKLEFYETENSDKPKMIQCPKCFIIPNWYEGRKAKLENDPSPIVKINGDVSNTRIVIGDNNNVGE